MSSSRKCVDDILLVIMDYSKSYGSVSASKDDTEIHEQMQQIVVKSKSHNLTNSRDAVRQIETFLAVADFSLPFLKYLQKQLHGFPPDTAQGLIWIVNLLISESPSRKEGVPFRPNHLDGKPSGELDRCDGCLGKNFNPTSYELVVFMSGALVKRIFHIDCLRKTNRRVVSREILASTRKRQIEDPTEKNVQKTDNLPKNRFYRFTAWDASLGFNLVFCKSVCHVLEKCE